MKTFLFKTSIGIDELCGIFFNCMTTSTIVFAMSAECTARWLTGKLSRSSEVYTK